MKLENYIYFDCYATVPASVQNSGFTSNYLRCINPSAAYAKTCGDKGLKVEENLIQKLAGILNTNSNNIIINSGGSEGNSNIIFSLGVFGNGKVVCSTLDHASILNGVYEMYIRGIPSSVIDVRNGNLEEKDVFRKIDKNTSLLLLTHVFSETGNLNNVEEIAKAVKAVFPNIHIHIDAVQSFMKVENSLPNTQFIDSIACSFHKIGGDKGCGFLWVKEPKKLVPIIFGNHNGGKRGGTMNVSGVASALFAIQETEALNRSSNYKNYFKIIYDALNKEFGSFCQILTNPKTALKNCIVVAFKNIDNKVLQNQLAKKGIIVGTGSACNNECLFKRPESSALIKSYNLTEEFSKPIRISWCNRTTNECVNTLLKELLPLVHIFKKGS